MWLWLKTRREIKIDRMVGFFIIKLKGVSAWVFPNSIVYMIHILLLWELLKLFSYSIFKGNIWFLWTILNKWLKVINLHLDQVIINNMKVIKLESILDNRLETLIGHGVRPIGWEKNWGKNFLI